MIYTILNAIIYCLLAAYLFAYRRNNWPAILLTVLYAVIAVMGIFYAEHYNWRDNIELWPYLYLFLVFLLYVRPILQFQPLTNLKITKSIKWIIAIYILCTIVNIEQKISPIVTLLQTGSWLSIKAAAYEGELGYATSFFQVIATLFVTTFMPLLLIMSFYYMSDSRLKFVKGLLLLVITITPDILSNILYAYRGGLLIISLSILSVYLIFKDKMNATRKKIWNIIMISIGTALLVLALAITFSRFGEDDSESSLVSYIGQPMVVFNGGIAVCAENTMEGRYFFSRGMKRDEIWKDSYLKTHTNNGSNLNTFVGCSYLDFGFLLTILIAIVVSFYTKSILKDKHKYPIATLYIYIFYLNYLFLGAFHSTIGYSRIVFLSLIAYYFLRILTSPQNKQQAYR